MYTNNSKHQQISTERLQYIQSIIENRKGYGKQVPLPVRNKMERLFDWDFSDVRIHEGPEASLIGAKAFTCGTDIYFAQGMYGPWSESGQRLLAHELAHVVQQREGRALIVNKNKLSIVLDQNLEDEADRMAEYVITGQSSDILKHNHFSTKHTTTIKPSYSPVIQCTIDGESDLIKVIQDLSSRKDIDVNSLLSIRVIESMCHDEEDHTVTDIIKKTRNMKRLFSNGLKRYRKSRTLRSTINIDQIQGERIAQLRQEQLKRVQDDLYFSELFGLQTVMDKTETKLGLRIHHQYSTTYLRDRIGDSDKLFEKLDEQKRETDEAYDTFRNQENCAYLFVNSIMIKKKIELLKNRTIPAEDMKFEKLCESIYCLRIKNKIPTRSGVNRNDILSQDQVNFFGYMPSIFQAVKALHKEEVIGDEIDNTDLLDEVKETMSTLVSSESDESYDLELIYQCIAKFISGLDAFQQNRKFKNSKVVKTALQSIHNILHILSISKTHTLNVSKLYELLVDELYMILATVSPYENHDAFETTAKAVYEDRIPALQGLEGVDLHIGLESSGMGALTTAYAGALDDSRQNRRVIYVGDEQEDDPIGSRSEYFELPKNLVSYLSLQDDNNNHSVILAAILNPSTPKGRYDMAHIVKVVKKYRTGERIVTLIIDITVEISKEPDGQLNEIIDGLKKELESGKLNIVLAKSFQKYSSLGSAKIMSGMVMAINSNHLGKFDNSIQLIKDVADNNKFYELDENQLMMYYLKNVSDFEIKLINKAAANATFINTLWQSSWDKEVFSKAGGESVLKNDDKDYLPDLPFVLRGVAAFGDTESKKIIGNLGFEYRDSFSFLNSSFLPIGFYAFRFTIGQESEARLVEKFYGLQFYSERPSSEDPEDNILKSEIEIENIIGEIERLTTSSESNKYQKIASLLNIAYLLYQKTNAKLLETKYQEFFSIEGNPSDKLTPEMKGTLSYNHLNLIFNTLPQPSGPPKKIRISKPLYEKIKKRAVNVPDYRLANLYINIKETIFSKLEKERQANITRLVLRGMGIESVLSVCEKVIDDGHKSKVISVSKYMWRHYLSVYALTQEDKATLTGVTLPEIPLNKVYPSKNEFMTVLKSVTDFNIKNKIVNAARKDKETSFYLEETDLINIEKAHTGTREQVKDLKYVYFTTQDELRVKLNTTIVSGTKDAIVQALVGYALARTKRVLVRQGLLAQDIASSVYFESIDKIRKIEERIHKIYKYKFLSTKKGRRTKAVTKIKELFAEIKTNKIRRNNALAMANEQSSEQTD